MKLTLCRLDTHPEALFVYQEGHPYALGMFSTIVLRHKGLSHDTLRVAFERALLSHTGAATNEEIEMRVRHRLGLELN